jgi:hypothetical protein
MLNFIDIYSFIPASGFVCMGPCTLLCPGVYNADKTAVCVCKNVGLKVNKKYYWKKVLLFYSVMRVENSLK